MRVFDFTPFEEELYPAWEARFRIGPGIGDFSYAPSGKPCLYGTTDILFNRAVMARLDLNETEKDAWAAAVNAFQDPGRGWYRKVYTHTHFKEHTTAYAVAALKLLDRRPRYDFAWRAKLISSPEERDRWIRSIPWSIIWPASHIVSGIPAILAMLGQGTPEFFAWYFDWLDREADPATGFWSRGILHRLGLLKRRSMHALGGAFHMYFVYEFLGRPWRYPERIVDAALKLQHANGLWDKDVTYCIDLDGIYSILRSSRNAGGYRADEVERACARYLETAARILNDREFFMTRYTNTHLLPGALAAIAECQRCYPELVKTSRPWVQTLDRACFI